MQFINKDGWFVSLHEITEVGNDHVTTDAGWSLYVNFNDKPPIDPGDIGVFYSTHDGWGGSIKGMFVNGIEYIPYLTKEQSDAKHQEWLDEINREKLENYEKNIDKWLATKESLRKPLRDRIQRFEDERSDFWHDMGHYELFCCEQADKLLTWAEKEANLGNGDVEAAINWFKNLSYDEQVKCDWYHPGHSGNTHDSMIWLAKAVAQGLDV